jgi:DnaJ homolog subfamily C member 25
VLTNPKVRKEYDSLRYNQEAYFQKYGTSVMWSYAPKTDVTMVALIIFIVANIFSWFSQKHRWQLVANRLTKAAVENWTPSQGGTPESKQLREHALEILAEQEKILNESTHSSGNSNGTTTTTTSAAPKKQKGSNKLPVKEKKRMEQEALLPIVKKLVNEMHDFGGGFHQPTWRDLFIVAAVKFPFTLTKSLLWQIQYTSRRLRNLELNDDEMEVMTRRAVGPVIWDTASEDERQALVKRELWEKDKLAEWNDEQEIKSMSAADQKAYYKSLKKKGTKME